MSKASRKPRTSPPRPARGWAAVKPFVLALLTLGLIVGVLLGLNELGRRAGLGLGPRDRYEVRFADIECNLPPESTREAFLAEVRASSGAPESFQLFDPGMPARLGGAFTSHPWVEAVESVAIEPPGAVRVSLKLRSPVLAVMAESEKSPRLVDAYAVLLPQCPIPSGTATLVNRIAPPIPQAGKPWPGEIVKRAVELVGVYHPTRLERTMLGWKLTMPDGKEVLVAK